MPLLAGAGRVRLSRRRRLDAAQSRTGGRFQPPTDGIYRSKTEGSRRRRSVGGGATQQDGTAAAYAVVVMTRLESVARALSGHRRLPTREHLERVVEA